MNNDKIKMLSDREKAREKLPIFYGSRSNYYHGFVETVNNGVDEIINNFDTGEINIGLSDDGYTVSVRDSGRGIPLEGKTDGVDNYELLFLKLFAGTNYDNADTGKIACGTNGVGLATLVFTSEYFKATVGRPDGNLYEIEFNNGGETEGLSVIGKSKETFTHLTFKLDKEVYTETKFIAEEIEAICDRICSMNSKVTITFTYLGETKVLHYENLESYFNKTVTNSYSDIIVAPPKSFNDEGEETTIQFVLSATTGESSQETFLNFNYLQDGGSIDEGLVEGIKLYCNKHAKDKSLYAKGEKGIANQDVQGAVGYVCSVLSTNVEYQSQTKKATHKKLYKELSKRYIQEQLEIYKIENPTEFDKFVGQILINMRARAKSSKMMENMKKKLSEEFTIINKVKGLIDCRSKDIDVNRLFICEGRSALSGLAQARNADTDALFAIRGKILNCLKADYDTILKNEVVLSILRLLGCGIEVKDKANKEFNMYDPSKLKYGTIVIGVDADPDGKNIRALLLTLFYRLLPSLIEEGRVKFVLAPLFEIEIDDNLYFATTVEEKDEILRTHKGKRVEVNRCKGLGENSVEASAETLMNPNYKGLHTVTMGDVEKAIEHFELFMGTDVAPRKKYIGENFDMDINDSYEKVVEVDQLLVDDCMEFSTYTVTDRALPSIDGLKPSQRRIMYSMYKQGLHYNKKRTKSANVSGDVMKLHPHGSTYPTTARLARKDTMNLPLVDGKGSFGLHGSQYIEPASERYTEVRLAEIAQTIFNGVDKGLVPMVDNYDNSQKEPAVLPVEMPLILINPTIGIAVGFSSNICGYNAKEVCYNTARMLRGEEVEVLVPEFSTGALMVNDVDTFTKIHNTGSGTIRQRAKYHVDGNKIVVTEIPYLSTIEAIEEKVVELVKNGTMKQITDINNYTDLHGLNITIDLKKGVDAKSVMDALYKETPLENTFSCNFTMLINGRPKTLGAKSIMEEWCNFRIGTATKQLEVDVEKIRKELEILYGFRNIFDHIDAVIEVIKKSETDEEVVTNLMASFGLNEPQATHIANLRLRRLNRDYLTKQLMKIADLEAQGNNLLYVLENEPVMRNMLAEQLEGLGDKYGRERRTEMVELSEVLVERTEIIPDYNVKLFGTVEGYIKKVPFTSLKANTNKLKEGDEIIFELDTKNNGELLVFTNLGNCYKYKLNDIRDNKMAELGVYLPTVLGIGKDERIVAYSATHDFKGYTLIFYKDNRVAKIDMEAYKTKTNRKVLAKSLYLGAEVLTTRVIAEEKQYKITTEKGREKILDTSSVSAKKTRDTQGVLMHSSKVDFVVNIEEVL